MATKKKVNAKNSRLIITVFVILIVIGVYFGYKNITGHAIASDVISGSAPVLSSPPLATGMVLLLALASMVMIAFLALSGRYQ